MNRREFTKSAGIALAGLVAGFGLSDGPGKTSASIDTEELSISDDSTTTRDGTISNVSVNLTGNWEYSVPNSKSPSKYFITLLVNPESGGIDVTSTTGEVLYLSDSGSYSLSGSLTETDAYSVSDFESGSKGETKTVEIPFQLRFSVVNSDGIVLASSSLSDTAVVDVTNEDYVASTKGSLDGSGSIQVE